MQAKVEEQKLKFKNRLDSQSRMKTRSNLASNKMTLSPAELDEGNFNVADEKEE